MVFMCCVVDVVPIQVNTKGGHAKECRGAALQKEGDVGPSSSLCRISSINCIALIAPALTRQDIEKG